MQIFWTSETAGSTVQPLRGMAGSVPFRAYLAWNDPDPRV